MMRDVLPYTIVLALAALLVAWSVAMPLGTIAAAKRGAAGTSSHRPSAVAGLGDPEHLARAAADPRVRREAPVASLARRRSRRTRGADPARDHDRNRARGHSDPADPCRDDRGARPAIHQRRSRARRTFRAPLLLRHALRNALLPVMTIGAAQLGALLSGTVVTEKIFERPGLGTLFLDAFFAGTSRWSRAACSSSR